MSDITTTDELPTLLPIAASVKRFGVSRGTLYRWLSDGSVKAKKIGRNTYLLCDTVQAKINDLPDYAG